MSASQTRLAAAERRALRGLMTLNAAFLRRLARELQRDSGLSAPEYEVLVNMDKAPENRMRVLELALKMQWEKSRLSKQISRMIDRGYLAREACPTDQRGSVIVLTDAGRDAFVEAERIHLSHVRELFFDALSTEQLNTLGELAETVVAHIDTLAPEDVSCREHQGPTTSASDAPPQEGCA
ncbi:MAG TPA: MarR family transcriptional regulator [Solirubrobacteraceae bacterium]